MTNEEAIKALRRYKPEDQGYVDAGIVFDNNYSGLALETAINALEKQERYRWHDLRKNPDDLPVPEREVAVVCERKFAGKSTLVYTNALYEDGTIRENDSMWSWIDIDGEYDEEDDCYIVPKGWWEYKHYCHYDEYNNVIDDDVVAWREIEPFEEVER